MQKKILLIGSANTDKARELATLLEGLPWEVKSLNDFAAVEAPEETGSTFEENATLKAHFYCQTFGVAVVADDSGLVVDVLGGAPGVYSARYAGPDCSYSDNNEKLLQQLEGVVWHERTARFVCVAAFLEPGGTPHLELGQVEGHISQVTSGDRGFGYDPLFVPRGEERSFGEMTPAEKHKMSHRGMAFAALRRWLESRA
jgi:XTP/dITP diphosphohydrolase